MLHKLRRDGQVEEEQVVSLRLSGNTRSCDLESGQGKLLTQGHKKILTFFSKPKFLVALATREKIYTDATVTRIKAYETYFVNKGQLGDNAQVL